MAITRSFVDANRCTDYSEEIMEIANEFSLVTDLGLFTRYNIDSTSVTFDKIENGRQLVPTSERGTHGVVKGQDDSVQPFQLPTTFHKYVDGFSKDDVLNYRKPATAADMETADAVRLEKFSKLRGDMAQTHEFMRLSALNGVTTDGYGNTLVDMYNEFGVTRLETDFLLGTNTTNVDVLLRKATRSVAKEAKMGMAVAKPYIICSEAFFDDYVSHETVAERYKYYNNNGVQRLRDSLLEIRDWGSISMFEDRNVTIIAYNPEFQLIDGSTVQVFDEAQKEGTMVVPSTSGLYREYFAPSDRFGDTTGQELFAFEDTREKGTGWDLETQSSSLFMLTKPLVAHRVFSSN